MRQLNIPPIVLFTPRRSPAKYAADCEATLDAVDKNPSFPDAGTAVTTARAALAAYNKAIDDVNHKVPDATKVRDDLKLPLKKAMTQIVFQVQLAVDQQPTQAASIAASAKMRLHKVPVRNKEPLSVADGLLSGEVALTAKAIPGARTYYWEYSSNGKDWLRAPDTAQAHTIISGLTVGQTYYFRVHALTRKGPTEPTQIKSLVVR